MAASGSSHLERLPTVVVQPIALLLLPEDRAQLAAVSKAMRNHLKAIVFENVRFIGNQDHLLEQLRTFIPKTKALGAMKNSFVRSARIVLSADVSARDIMSWGNSFDFIEPRKDEAPLTSAILRALDTMDSLQSPSLDVYGLAYDEQKKMGTLIPLRAKFKLKSLRVRASRDLTHIFPKHYGTIETEQPTRSTNLATIDAVAVYFQSSRTWSLLKFRPTTTAIAAWSGPRLIYNSQVVLEKHCYKLPTTFSTQNKQFTDFIKSLEKFPNLRRVAFTMRRCRFAPGFLEPAVGHIRRRVPDWEWKGFFEGHINKVAQKYPQLTDVCIFVEFPRAYKGIRMTDGRMVVDDVKMGACDGPLTFPFWLVV
ncbi:hypothetical protein NM208_g5854 [Fusarium decemcellulare]|uniref:Uncharacterized protein n=1 Tax=Fusarium decemcellulare TaxID=57161 RepID=A0ACC1SFC7_9HYPO|nr:hypothetical protein NM208_g5854 [Fusarium decemcellulare]